MLDELDEVALLLARESGRPRTEAALGDLPPAVAGLSDLADDGPGALADRRLGRPALLRAGRRATGVQQPRGVVGVLGAPSSPWTEPDVVEAPGEPARAPARHRASGSRRPADLGVAAAPLNGGHGGSVSGRLRRRARSSGI